MMLSNRPVFFVLAPVLVITLVVSGCGKSDLQGGQGPETDVSTAGDVSDSDSVAVDSMVAGSASAGIDTMAAPSTSKTDQRGNVQGTAHFYEISTPVGKMVVRLYDETPKHRDNFIKLVKEGYYDGTTFHRVIEGFMIQGGDGNSKDDDPFNDGQGEIDYTVEAEIRPGLFHKRGALAAARQPDQVNPERASSGSQFYIVQGTPLSSEQLADMETQLRQRDPSFAIPPEAAEVYGQVGGTPFLDTQYTVFGELVEGYDVLDAIAATETPRKRGERTNPALIDRPPEAITMTVRPLSNYAAQ